MLFNVRGIQTADVICENKHRVMVLILQNLFWYYCADCCRFCFLWLLKYQRFVILKIDSRIERAGLFWNIYPWWWKLSIEGKKMQFIQNMLEKWLYVQLHVNFPNSLCNLPESHMHIFNVSITTVQGLKNADLLKFQNQCQTFGLTELKVLSDRTKFSRTRWMQPVIPKKIDASQWLLHLVLYQYPA
jgi:hypothetical protein